MSKAKSTGFCGYCGQRRVRYVESQSMADTRTDVERYDRVTGVRKVKMPRTYLACPVAMIAMPDSGYELHDRERI